MIPYGRQDVTENDIAAVVEVLRSDFLTQGPVVPRFETAVAARCGAAHAVAVNSATSALHVACLALGLGPGKRLWTVPNTFVASANCARYCGAAVEFVDIAPDTWNLSVPALRDKLVRAKLDGCLPDVMVPVDFAGLPVAQAEIHALAEEYGFRIIEDASHAIGASRDGIAVGSGQHADITVFSFHPVKIVTTGEGGMALTNDEGLAWRMALLRSHGITRESGHMVGRTEGAWYYEQIDLGFNYRLTDFQAALGLSQLGHLDDLVRERNRLAERYKASLTGLPVEWQEVDGGAVSAYHLFPVQVADGIDRAVVFRRMRDDGIGVNVHYMPVHLQPYWRARGFAPGMFPEAERHGDRVVTLPLYPTMGDERQDRVIAALKDALR